jgi:dihydrofolate reductase
MKLTATVFATLDSAYQGPGGPNEDRRNGFEPGGWLAPYADDESGPSVLSTYERADALLLGRMTWAIWEPYWPNHDDNPVGHIINTLAKYVPSTTLTDPAWHTHVIATDVEARVRALKDQPGRDLLVAGSGALLRWLLERDLVDELELWLYPIVLGDGLWLLPEHGQTHDLKLIGSRRTPSGVMIQTYQPAGRAALGSID